MTFKCCMCGNKKPAKEKVFVTQSDDEGVCVTCFEEEGQRSAREDTIPGKAGFIRSRPPKYILPPSEWARYGY